ncbi:MAG: PQQ-binding-like beta-propeller repeat protein [Planctomycetia bacterium]|nr:PQQ-binding-like beta-propeller repeat protein [Planctomycetia bacterium]
MNQPAPTGPRSNRVSRRTFILPRIVIILAAPGLVTLSAAADWLQFRGSRSNSVTLDVQPPAKWSETENLAWKAKLPGRGPSSPIVIGERVVVTCSSGINQDRLHVLCFAAQSGQQLWERQFWATGRTLSHPSSANAAPTPASDGKLIFAFYSSNDLICLDIEGNLKWLRGLAHDYPHAGNDVGMSSSPAVVGGLVVVQVECQGESFAAGIDPETGESRWRINRPREASWASPVAMPGATPQQDVVLLQSPSQITAHEATTGKQLWVYKSPCDGISSAAAAGGVVYVPSKGLTALRSTSDPQPEVVWNASALLPGAASPVVDRGRLLVINRAGVLACASTVDGQIAWRVRLEGEFWGTPTLAGNRLYCISQNGAGQVVEISVDGSRGEIVGKGQLEGPIQCSPAISGGALYVRSDRHLWKIAAP